MIGDKRSFGAKTKKIWTRDRELYLLCIPAMLYVFIFMYGPMYGVQIAFRDFTAKGGITGSTWVGLKHFIRFINTPSFYTMLRNTVVLNLYSLAAGFPIPIIIALLMNQCHNVRFKKTVQTVLYAPHFVSVVVLVGMLELFLSPRTGVVNHILAALGLDRIYFMGEARLFPHVYVWSGIWQNTGWGTIIYMAALSAINPELYEAARMDGANKSKIIRYVDIPSIAPTMITLFILNMGSFMSVGFQKAFLMQNPLNEPASEIIATYVYKIGLLNSQFSYSTAIGLFNTVINIVLLLVTNKISKKVSEISLF